ncbi:MAG: cupin domain-containing protein [Actinomycetota bacterium]|nr:cupin domain-containing protein [Actinomycetota bacterium]
MSGQGSELKLGPSTRIRIVRSEADELAVEATYAPGSPAPPNHLHPSQDEFFEILEGAMQVKVGAAAERTLRAGETIDVPRATPHTMWNAADAPARTRWVTRPAGRTEEWFRTLDSFQRRAESGATIEADEYTRALGEYEDVFRLVFD